MTDSAIVLGAGMVGVSTALHLRRRGWDVTLVDRQGPGEGASFGNAGLIQREAVFPHAFPRRLADLVRIARNRSIDVAYDPLALPGLAAPLLRYWWESEPTRYQAAVAAHSRLIATCLDEHRALAEEAEVTALLRPIGYFHVYGTAAAMDAAVAVAEAARAYGVNSRVLDAAALAEAEPHLAAGKVGAIHWTDPYSVSDPHGLTNGYARLYGRLGGVFAMGDAASLERAGAGWRVQTADGVVEARQVVVALGAGATRLTQRFGYTPPLFGKRGYHYHYGLQGNAVLSRPVLDSESGYLLIPMRAGIRLTTGAEFARTAAEASPLQLARAEPVARRLMPSLADRVEAQPWMGVRPCTPDMLPILGAMPGQAGLWCAFGHAHQGLTLGPTTGRLMADMMTGEAPFLDPAPYRPERFH